MEFKEVLKELAGNQLKPVYLVSSEELYFMDKLIHWVTNNLLPKEQQDFNLASLYGKETNIKNVLDLAREFPFLGERKIILVRDAQDIKDWDLLAAYLKNPNPSTILFALFTKKPDGRASWVKTAKETGYWHEWKSLSDYQLPSFLLELSKDMQLKFEEQALALLLEYVGNDLSTLANELEKLKLNVTKGTTIGKLEIEKYIGVSKEFNVFELQKALNAKDHTKSFRIFHNLAIHSKSNPIIATIASLFNHFNRIWLTKLNFNKSDDELSKLLKLPFKNFVKDYREAASKYSLAQIEEVIDFLNEYDLKSKGLYNHSTTEKDLYIEIALNFNQLN
ncbi:MAG: DNA polymerase III subunit delta [Saprospiraceae bacterium]